MRLTAGHKMSPPPTPPLLRRGGSSERLYFKNRLPLKMRVKKRQLGRAPKSAASHLSKIVVVSMLILTLYLCHNFCQSQRGERIRKITKKRKEHQISKEAKMLLEKGMLVNYCGGNHRN